MKQFQLLLFLFVVCGCNQPLKSTLFTEKAVFTSGIEGPATDADGNIYAVNFGKEGTIGKVTPEGSTSLFVALPEGSTGNGIRFGGKDQMFVADYTSHSILEVDMNSKEVKIFARDSTANQPNDIAIAPNKTLYASDPNWSDNTGNLWKVTKEKGFELLEKGMGTTNGVEVSHDGKKLYVNESVQRKVWVYDIKEDGTVTNKKQFHAFEDFGLDGMRFHKNGNLFICRYDKGTVAILSPEGTLVEEITLIGKKPTNITFSNDFRYAYITVADCGCVERVDLKG